jgi:integral membrane protein
MKMNNNEEKNKWLKRFRLISVLEGISFLVLLFIAMPLKYMFDSPMAVTYVGWAHGLLFLIYILAVFPTARKLSWSFAKTSFALAASVLPFGPFIFHKNLSAEEKEMVKS